METIRETIDVNVPATTAYDQWTQFEQFPKFMEGVESVSYEAEGLMEQLGAKIGLDSRQVGADLTRFKQLVETTGAETGAWRGEVHAGERTS